METEEQDTTEALMKRGMGVSVAPENYQPTSPRYIRAGEDSGDEADDQDEVEDLEAPYLAPKSALSSEPAQSEGPVQMPATEDLSDLESIPELINLMEEEKSYSLPLPRKPNIPPH